MNGRLTLLVLSLVALLVARSMKLRSNCGDQSCRPIAAKRIAASSATRARWGRRLASNCQNARKGMGTEYGPPKSPATRKRVPGGGTLSGWESVAWG